MTDAEVALLEARLRQYNLSPGVGMVLPFNVALALCEPEEPARDPEN